MYYLAECYEYGTGVEENDAEARKWYRKAADEGCAPAQRRIGRYYADEGKYKDAMRWYEKAAEQGDGVSMNRIALLYSNGKGVHQDANKAFGWFQRSAEEGFGWGMYNLAHCYENGDGVQQNDRIAKEWYEKAAYKQIPEAECRLGEYCLDEGNYAKARFWYKRAADRGNGEALNMQGILRSSEEYGLHNDGKAVEYFRQSAEAGYGWGMYNLAHCYETGSGVQKNLKLAGEWYAKAADEGIEPAIEWLNG